MIDLKLIRDDKDHVLELLKRKGWETNFDELLKKDDERHDLRIKVEQNKAKINEISARVPHVKKEGGDIAPLLAEVKQIKTENVAGEQRLKVLDEEIKAFLEELPNLPDEDLAPGGKENNVVLKQVNKKRTFDFPIKNHVELAEDLGLIDYKRSAKISGAGTWIYTDLGARLEWALLNYFINEHLNDGFKMMLVPHLLNEESGYTAGQFPKFRDDVFWLENMEPKRFLLPTAETALVNLHRNEILKKDELPLKYFSYTPCYRKEAGSYRSEERGMIRGYQFNKVEMVEYTTNTDSDRAFEELVNKASKLVEKLGLHFQISKLAAGDCSHAMARTYDIEVWLPSLGIYKEVSSASNARDYQARRGLIRYREDDGSIAYCHTLNASGLATSRLFPAILEQYQQEDGSVVVPEVLRPYLGGLEVIRKQSK
jgi:seryl-tRNA synthetase